MSFPSTVIASDEEAVDVELADKTKITTLGSFSSAE